ncbi:MAG TPA: peptidyl-tRNA hydrolase [Actinocrinis sp.]|nr:peptidyl-tRNA hydrolase [Actinocrinis sp.]
MDTPADADAEHPFTPTETSRDDAEQYVLPLVVRIERDAPPARTDALQTAARAVLTLLADPRSRGEGEWAALIEAWQDGRIRKVVRRARGAEWRKAQDLPGITLQGEHAEIRVYPPVPLDGWPPALAKLQVSGTELDDPEAPAAPEPGTAVLWLNPGVQMTAGKAMAQVGHAAQLGWWTLADDDQARWAEAGFPLAVRTATPEQWHKLAAADLPTVRDAGFTEVTPGSTTAIAQL